ncbi:MAG: hypothetical protein V2J24_01960, partial [Pseudomonadales bacterium]|nr:hypothetical protein [Pseudomonadales bacterium]
MAGPARAGLFVYAKDATRTARFYEAVTGMHRLHETAELIVLESPDIQLVVHAIPERYAREIDITEPPQRREEAACKFFFSVASLDAARSAAARHGGAVFDDTWQ